MLRKLFLVIFLGFICLTAEAAHPIKIPKDISVKIHFDYQFPFNQNTFSYKIASQIKMLTKNQQWVVIQDSKSLKSSRVILLGKIEHADAKKIQIEFLILDSEAKISVIAKPKLIVLYGQKAELAIKDGKEKLHLIVQANV